MMALGHSTRCKFSIDVVMGCCIGLVVFHEMVQPALSEDWDSETFVKELDELKGRDRDLVERGREDTEWATYIRGIEPEYDEKGFPEITTSDPANNFFAQKLNWSLTGRGEVPYLAVIYQLMDNEVEEDREAMWGVTRQRACGGVLVSTERLITICICVASYFAATIYQTPIAEENADPPYVYDLGMRTLGGKYQIDGKLNRIYVQFGSNRYFTGKNMQGVKDPRMDRHLVDSEEQEKFGDMPKLTTHQTCGKLVGEAWRNGQIPRRQPDTELTNYWKMKDTLALVPFWPSINHPAPGQFVPWPSVPFSDQHTMDRMSLQHEREEQVIVTGIGFEKNNETECGRAWKLLDDEGQEIPLHKQAINLPYVHKVTVGRDEEICRGKTEEETSRKLSCFVDLYEPNTIGLRGCKTITGGVIGWPIIWQGKVVALTASPRSPVHSGNRILGTSLHWGEFSRHVEETLTNEKIRRQRTARPPMFREDIVDENGGDSFVFYDYPEQPNWVHFEGSAPKVISMSLAVHFGPHPDISILTPLVSVFMYLASL